MSDTEKSSRRAEANRRNAQKSTGPRTAEGKGRSRFNAVKHGMRAATAVLPGEDADSYQARLDAWTAELEPRDEVERFLVGRAVRLSWQLERADRAEAARQAGAGSAAADRLADRADRVAALGSRLFWDPRGPICLYPLRDTSYGEPELISWAGRPDEPDDPARLLNRLESSALGCAWLLDRWADLRTLLESGQAWQPPDRFRAIRLLGRQPMDLLDDRRVMTVYLATAAMEPEARDEFADVATELESADWNRLIERIHARNALAGKPTDPEAGRTALLEIVDEEEDRLEEELAIHLECGEPPVEAAEFDDTQTGERLRKYQLASDRALLRVLEALRKRRKESGEAPAEAGYARRMMLRQTVSRGRFTEGPLDSAWRRASPETVISQHGFRPSSLVDHIPEARRTARPAEEWIPVAAGPIAGTETPVAMSTNEPTLTPVAAEPLPVAPNPTRTEPAADRRADEIPSAPGSDETRLDPVPVEAVATPRPAVIENATNEPIDPAGPARWPFRAVPSLPAVLLGMVLAAGFPAAVMAGAVRDFSLSRGTPRARPVMMRLGVFQSDTDRSDRSDRAAGWPESLTCAGPGRGSGRNTSAAGFDGMSGIPGLRDNVPSCRP